MKTYELSQSKKKLVANGGTTNVSSIWGPHYNVETDVLLGRNAYSFGSPYASTSHSSAITNSMLIAGMGATDTTSVNKDKVGGHSFPPILTPCQRLRTLQKSM
ncbi:MAG: hypothetical protein MZV64_69525 [Ignavibacteriales bacterium]|nr:hypothetical protein [Ignavibacteriales bacterium]